MCARCDELEEQVAYWKGEAGAVSHAGLRAELRRQFRLPKREARVLEILYRHKGRPVSRARVLELADIEARSPTVASVLVNSIRAKLGAGSILTRYSEGYSIGPGGAAAIEAARTAGAA